MKSAHLFLAAGFIALSACNDGSDSVSASDQSNRAYIDAIVPHHEMALSMADDAIAKATHASLKEMAQMMKTDQAREIGQFKSARANLFGSDSTPMPMDPQPIPAGPDFDKMWMEMMISHHQGAIDQSTLALDAGIVSPLDSLARHTIDEQKKEQGELRDSLKAWYRNE